jgi:hypothetical protein
VGLFSGGSLSRNYAEKNSGHSATNWTHFFQSAPAFVTLTFRYRVNGSLIARRWLAAIGHQNLSAKTPTSTTTMDLHASWSFHIDKPWRSRGDFSEGGAQFVPLRGTQIP